MKFGNIDQLHAKPGDIIVVNVPANSSPEECQAAADALKPYIEYYPYSFFVVLPDDCRITMLSDDDLNEMGLKRVNVVVK